MIHGVKCDRKLGEIRTLQKAMEFDNQEVIGIHQK